MLEWFGGQAINITIIIISVIGFISLLVSGVVYSTLVKASGNMGFTESKLIKQIKLKYANCYKLELYTNEVQAFIDHYLYKKKILKVPLYIWEHLSLEMMYVSMVLGLLGTFVNITYYQQNEITPISNAFLTGILGFGLATLLLIIKVLFAIQTKKQIFYSNVTDYLENILRNKLEQQSKKEVEYEANKKIEKMENENSKDKKDNSISKENNRANNVFLQSITKGKQNRKKRTTDEPIKEDIIEDVINQLISG